MPYSIRLHIEIHTVIVTVMPYNVILHINIIYIVDVAVMSYSTKLPIDVHTVSTTTHTVDAAAVLCSYTVIYAVM